MNRNSFCLLMSALPTPTIRPLSGPSCACYSMNSAACEFIKHEVDLVLHLQCSTVTQYICPRGCDIKISSPHQTSSSTMQLCQFVISLITSCRRLAINLHAHLYIVEQTCNTSSGSVWLAAWLRQSLVFPGAGRGEQTENLQE